MSRSWVSGTSLRGRGSDAPWHPHLGATVLQLLLVATVVALLMHGIAAALRGDLHHVLVGFGAAAWLGAVVMVAAACVSGSTAPSFRVAAGHEPQIDD